MPQPWFAAHGTPRGRGALRRIAEMTRTSPSFIERTWTKCPHKSTSRLLFVLSRVADARIYREALGADGRRWARHMHQRPTDQCNSYVICVALRAMSPGLLPRRDEAKCC